MRARFGHAGCLSRARFAHWAASARARFGRHGGVRGGSPAARFARVSCCVYSGGRGRGGGGVFRRDPAPPATDDHPISRRVGVRRGLCDGVTKVLQ